MDSMMRQPQRTCIACRNVFNKDEVVRVVAGPDSIVIDYREKLPGRAAYVCPQMACITKATTKDGLAKALRTKVKSLTPEEFRERLVVGLKEKIKSLISMSAKAGKLAAGYSAVHDALEKGRVKMLLYATDLSEGTRDKVAPPDSASIRQATLFTRDEFGKLINRELVGVIGIEDRGIADAIAKETERLKCLINNGE